jgi:hypothetical protein
MYRLYVTNVETELEQCLEFETFELACLYRDYHLAFGNWVEEGRWLPKEELLPELEEFIVDQKFVENLGTREIYFRVLDKFKIKVLKEEKSTASEAWDLLRKRRNSKLYETDWVMLSDAPTSSEEKKKWREYREYLRTLPTLHNDDTVLNAKVYTFEEWNSGKR